MENYVQDERLSKVVTDIQQGFLTKVYGWMTLGLITTAVVALYIVSSGLIEVIFRSRMSFYVILFGQLGLVFYLSSRINTMSARLAISLFLLYSAITGITFSVIFIIYTAESIA